ncbi:hypothetical protein MAR_030280 [Mya arenaria]|uniref:Uncharacterized protein n=1 Tax=Mya arenaria TaxID=6604 RepID=A0ABY7DLM3_MYAAR|nr:hypothetical protein MAR_030280 [Mya arenaria]
MKSWFNRNVAFPVETLSAGQEKCLGHWPGRLGRTCGGCRGNLNDDIVCKSKKSAKDTGLGVSGHRCGGVGEDSNVDLLSEGEASSCILERQVLRTLAWDAWVLDVVAADETSMTTGFDEYEKFCMLAVLFEDLELPDMPDQSQNSAAHLRNASTRNEDTMVYASVVNDARLAGAPLQPSAPHVKIQPLYLRLWSGNLMSWHWSPRSRALQNRMNSCCPGKMVG